MSAPRLPRHVARRIRTALASGRLRQSATPEAGIPGLDEPEDARTSSRSAESTGGSTASPRGRKARAKSHLEAALANLLRLGGAPEFEWGGVYGLSDVGGLTPGKPRNYAFDFAWRDVRVAVEVQGGVWRKGGGAHSHPSNIERDAEKYALAAAHGWTVVPVTERMIRDGLALRLILATLETKGPRGLGPTHRAPEDHPGGECGVEPRGPAHPLEERASEET